jgi:hypothetical protein
MAASLRCRPSATWDFTSYAFSTSRRREVLSPRILGRCRRKKERESSCFVGLLRAFALEHLWGGFRRVKVFD